MEKCAAGSTGQAPNPTSIGGCQTAAGATGQPAAGALIGSWQRETMAHGHHKIILGRVDGRHARTEAAPMHLLLSQHPVHPGVDHLVTERAQQCLPGQGGQQWPRQHDLAQRLASPIDATPVQTGGATHAAIAPAQLGEGTTIGRQAAIKVLAIESVEQRQQGFERHGRCWG